METDHPTLDYAKPEKRPYRFPLAVRIFCALVSIPVACLAILDLLFTIAHWGDDMTAPGLVVGVITWSASILLWWLAGIKVRPAPSSKSTIA